MYSKALRNKELVAYFGRTRLPRKSRSFLRRAPGLHPDFQRTNPAATSHDGEWPDAAQPTKLLHRPRRHGRKTTLEKTKVTIDSHFENGRRIDPEGSDDRSHSVGSVSPTPHP